MLRVRNGRVERVAVEGWITLETARQLCATAGQDFATLKAAVVQAFQELRQVPVDALLEQRYQKFRRMGVFEEG